jgi:hypothetical protein
MPKTYTLPSGDTCRKRKEYLNAWTNLGQEYAEEVLGPGWALIGFDPTFSFGNGRDHCQLPGYVVIKTLDALDNARTNPYC